MKTLIKLSTLIASAAGRLIPHVQGPNVIPSIIQQDQNGVAKFLITTSDVIHDGTGGKKLSQDERKKLKEGKLFLENLITDLSEATNNKIILAKEGDENPAINHVFLFPFEDRSTSTGYYNVLTNDIGIHIKYLRDDSFHGMEETLRHELLHRMGIGHPHEALDYKISLNILRSPSDSETNPSIIENPDWNDYHFEKDDDYRKDVEYRSWNINVNYDPNQPINERINYGNSVLNLLNDDVSYIRIAIRVQQGAWNINSNSSFQEVNTAASYTHFYANTLNEIHYKKAAMLNPNYEYLAKLTHKYEKLLKAQLTIPDIIFIQQAFQGCSTAKEMIKGSPNHVLFEACGYDNVKLKCERDETCTKEINKNYGNKQFVTAVNEDFRQFLEEKGMSELLKTNYQCDPKESVPLFLTDYLGLLEYLGHVMRTGARPNLKDDNLEIGVTFKDEYGNGLKDHNGNSFDIIKNKNNEPRKEAECDKTYTEFREEDEEFLLIHIPPLVGLGIFGCVLGALAATTVLSECIKAPRDNGNQRADIELGNNAGAVQIQGAHQDNDNQRQEGVSINNSIAIDQIDPRISTSSMSSIPDENLGKNLANGRPRALINLASIRSPGKRSHSI
jgi:hypothetical protein